MPKQQSIKEIKKTFLMELVNIYATQEINSISQIAIEHILGLTYTQQQIKAADLVSEDSSLKLKNILTRLKNNEPIQYILGETEFYGLNFNVSPDVLIPRQETELLVDMILKSELPKNPKIIDIGTGSGCIPICLKKHLPNASVFAIDISEKALEIAKSNAIKNNVEVNFSIGNILDSDLSFTLDFDLIVSNPPYVMEKEMNQMHANVNEHEPHLALFVPDNNALKFYTAISKFSKKQLTNSGTIWLEINEALGVETMQVFKHDGFKTTKLFKDLENKNRIVCAKR